MLAVLVVAACGSGDGPVERPAQVPDGLVPAEIAGGQLRFYPKEDKETKDAFANAGDRSLQADARLWELRQSERLVGALQITTVVDKLDLTRRSDRTSLLRQIFPGTVNQLEIGETPVWVSRSNDKVVYLWFGRGMFEVLQLKGTRLEPEAVVTEVVEFQARSKAWVPLPAEAYLDD